MLYQYIASTYNTLISYYSFVSEYCGQMFLQLCFMLHGRMIELFAGYIHSCCCHGGRCYEHPIVDDVG